MHNKLVAYEKTVKVFNKLPDVSKTGMLIDLIYMLSIEFKIDPKPYVCKNSGSIWILFEHSCFLCDSFFEEYGISAAFLSQRYPLTLYGISSGNDSCELTAKISDDLKTATFTKKNVSGKNFDEISDICVKIDIGDPDALACIHEIATNLSYRYNYISLSRNPWCKEELSEFDESDVNTFYQYIIMNAYVEDEFINSLSVEQKKKLWVMFLSDGVSSVEFDYAIELLGEGIPYNIFTWELSLRLALSEEGIDISYDNNDFRITDKNQNRIRFDYLHGTAAEKLLLKILFPVKAH